MANSKRNDDKLKNLSKSEILDLLERQKRLLANTKFIARLPDKGDKIRRETDRLEKALAQRGSVDETAKLFQLLNLGQRKVQDSQDLDSDDDVPDTDSAQRQENGILERVPTPSDALARSASVSTAGQEMFVAKLTQLLEPESGRPAHLMYHFRVNRELRTTRVADLVPQHAPRDKPGPWVETAVTPPPSKFDEARLIPLKESLELVRQHEEALKELAIIQATEQLAFHRHIKKDSGLQDEYGTRYRDVASEDEGSEED